VSGENLVTLKIVDLLIATRMIDPISCAKRNLEPCFDEV